MLVKNIRLGCFMLASLLSSLAVCAGSFDASVEECFKLAGKLRLCIQYLRGLTRRSTKSRIPRLKQLKKAVKFDKKPVPVKTLFEEFLALPADLELDVGSSDVPHN